MTWRAGQLAIGTCRRAAHKNPPSSINHRAMDDIINISLNWILRTTSNVAGPTIKCLNELHAAGGRICMRAIVVVWGNS